MVHVASFAEARGKVFAAQMKYPFFTNYLSFEAAQTVKQANQHSNIRKAPFDDISFANIFVRHNYTDIFSLDIMLFKCLYHPSYAISILRH